jgi:hypothetical protein
MDIKVGYVHILGDVASIEGPGCNLGGSSFVMNSSDISTWKCFISYILQISHRIKITIIATHGRVIKSRRMRWSGHVSRMGGRRGIYRVLVVRPEG